MLKASYKYLYKSEKELNCFACMCVCVMWTERTKKDCSFGFERQKSGLQRTLVIFIFIFIV